ncbi:MAG: TetR family transcriptional regulator [Pseudomonadota bacterium]
MTASANATDGTRRRARGEQTRARIIEAALDVIAEGGVGAVTHRAVARQADVQLSLTTYYFKDLNTLLLEAFEHFAKRGRPELDALWDTVFSEMEPGRPASVEQLTAVATDYIWAQVQERPRGLSVEQSFFNYARLDAAVRPLADAHLAALRAPLVKLCERLGTALPELDGTLLLGTLMRLEYEAASGLAGRGRDETAAIIHRQIECLARPGYIEEST